MAEELEIEEIRYYRVKRPPTLKQYVFRRAVKERMAEIKGQLGVTINPDTSRPIPVSALAAREALKGLTAERILVEHPEWKEEYEREFGGEARNIHPGRG